MREQTMSEQTMKKRHFVLLVNDTGFIPWYGDKFVLNIINALRFDSLKEAEKYRTKLYKSDNELFQIHAIVILEWA